MSREYTESAEAALIAHTSHRHKHHANGSDDLEGPVTDTLDLDSSAESESLSHDYKDSVTDTSDTLDGPAESEPPSPRDTRRIW